MEADLKSLCKRHHVQRTATKCKAACFVDRVVKWSLIIAFPTTSYERGGNTKGQILAVTIVTRLDKGLGLSQ